MRGKRVDVTKMGNGSISLAHAGVIPQWLPAKGKPPEPSKSEPSLRVILPITDFFHKLAVSECYAITLAGDVLLAEAGSPKLNLTLVATSSQTEKASAIQTALKRAGITVTIKTLDSTVYSDTVRNAGDFDLAISSWQPDFPSPYANIAPLFDSSQIGNGNMNESHYNNPEVDKLIAQATGTVDKAKALKQWAEIDKRIMEDVPVVPLIYSHNTFLRGSQVANFMIGTFPAYPDYLVVGLSK